MSNASSAFTADITGTSYEKHAPNSLLPWVKPRGGGGGEPIESPLKVWDGSEWRPAGVSVKS